MEFTTIFDYSVSIFYSRKISVFVIDNFEYIMVELINFFIFFSDLYLLSPIKTSKDICFVKLSNKYVDTPRAFINVCSVFMF